MYDQAPLALEDRLDIVPHSALPRAARRKCGRRSLRSTCSIGLDWIRQDPRVPHQIDIVRIPSEFRNASLGFLADGVSGWMERSELWISRLSRALVRYHMNPQFFVSAGREGAP